MRAGYIKNKMWGYLHGREKLIYSWKDPSPATPQSLLLEQKDKEMVFKAIKCCFRLQFVVVLHLLHSSATSRDRTAEFDSG